MTVAAGLFCACGGPSQFSKRAGGLPGRSAYAGTAPAARPGLSARTPVPDLRSLDSGGAGRRLCAHACPRELGDGWRAGGMLPGSASRPVSPRRVACGGMRLPATPGKPRRVCRHRETDAAETAFPVTWGRGGCDHAARLHVQGTTSGRGPLPPEYRGQGEAGRQTGETGGRTAGVPGEAERCLTGDIGGRETGQPVRWLRLPDASGGGSLKRFAFQIIRSAVLRKTAVLPRTSGREALCCRLAVCCFQWQDALEVLRSLGPVVGGRAAQALDFSVRCGDRISGRAVAEAGAAVPGRADPSASPHRPVTTSGSGGQASGTARS